jgi:hypothetical protein
MTSSEKNIFIFIYCVILIYFYGCDLSSTSGYYGNLKGKVNDSTTHEGLNSVHITTIPASQDTIADADGNFTLTNIPMSNSSGTVTIIASRPRYITNIITVDLKSDDTVNVRLALLPADEVFFAYGLLLNQYENFYSLSAVNLRNIRVLREYEFEVDARFRNNQNNVYLKTGYDELTTEGFQTKFSPLIGKYSETEFDTLARYYGASEPIDPYIDFPYNNTTPTPAPSARNNVYAFYLKGRYSPGNSYRIYGLVHVDSSWYYGPTKQYKILIDVKINTLEQNYFVHR